MTDRTTTFARRVVSGEFVAGPSVRAACQRHLNDLLTGEDRGLWFDQDAADRAFRYFEQKLRLNGGQFEGRPFTLHESQEFKIGSLFGWKRDDGTRRFREAYIEEAKGNGKTPLVAGIGHYGLTADREPRAEVYAAASSKDQAMVLFRDACAMRDQSPWLRERLSKRGGDEHPQNLLHMKTASFFRPVSPEGAHSGPRPHMALLDELHEHRSRNIYDMLKRGFKFRRQPLMVMITNSGYDRKTLCWEKHEHAIKVATGEVIDDEFFSYVCDLDEGDDPFEDETCWIKVNPLLGVTVQPEYLRGVIREAIQQPGAAANIKRLHFCIWTESDKAWLTYKAIQPLLHEFDPFEVHRDKLVSLGLDLGETDDMSALAAVVETGKIEVEHVGRDGKTYITREPTFDAWVEAWTPAETAQDRSRRDKSPYPLWIEQGHLIGHPGARIKLPTIAKRLLDYQDTFKIRGLAYDRYAFDKFEEVCDEININVPFYEHPQGGKRKAYIPQADDDKGRTQAVVGADGKVKTEKVRPALWMPNSKRLFEDAVKDKRIRLRGNPVLVQAILSAAVSDDEWENQWLVKKKSTQRIDPVVALVMALGLAYVELPKSRYGRSYLKTGDLIIV